MRSRLRGMPLQSWIAHAHANTGLVQGSHYAPLVPPVASHKPEAQHRICCSAVSPAPQMRGCSVAHVMTPTRQVQFQLVLGNVQASVDSIHRFLSHSCRCKLVPRLRDRSIVGSSLRHAHKPFSVRTHWLHDPCKRRTNPFVLMPSCHPAETLFHLPVQTAPATHGSPSRYKRCVSECERTESGD